MNSDDVNGLPDLFRYLRDVSDVDQNQISDKTGIATSTLSNYERSKRFPPIDRLVQFLEFFGGKVRIETDVGDWIIRLSESNEKRVRLETAGEKQALEDLPEDEIEDIFSFIQKRRRRNQEE